MRKFFFHPFSSHLIPSHTYHERKTNIISRDEGVSTLGLWHYPALITNESMAHPIAKFSPAGDFSSDTVAAVINEIDGREQQAWFISWATDWSQTSNFLQHAYIHWVTRGLCKSTKLTVRYFNLRLC
jgi:hypothetical protein